MFVYEPGAGMSGETVRVESGFEVNVTENWWLSAREMQGKACYVSLQRGIDGECNLSNTCPELVNVKTDESKRFIIINLYVY